MTARHARHYAVIGAGILGSAVALRLAERGIQVTIFDKDLPCSGATKWSLAWLNSNNKGRASYHELNAAGLASWTELVGQLGGDSWYRPVGNLEWCTTEQTRIGLVERVKRLAELGYPAELIDASTAYRLEPSIRLPKTETDIAWFPSEGYLLAEPLIEQLLATAAKHGAKVVTGQCGHVIGFDSTTDGVSAVHTAADEVIPVDAVVVTAGQWTSQLAALLGASVPLLAWDGSERTPGGLSATGLVVRAAPAANAGLRRVIHAPGVNLRLHTDGLVHLEPRGISVGASTSESELRHYAQETLERAGGTISCLAQAQIVDYRVCVRPVPVDGYPVIGWLPGMSNAYVIVTHSGMTLGAHLAKLTVSELLNGVQQNELAEYRPNRFAALAGS